MVKELVISRSKMSFNFSFLPWFILLGEMIMPEKEQQQENKKINDKYILIAEAFVTCQEQI